MNQKSILFDQVIDQLAELFRNGSAPEDGWASALHILKDALCSEAGTIWLLEPHSGRLSPLCNLGPVDISGISIENGQGIAGTVVKSGDAAIIENAGRDALFFRGVDDRSGFVTRNLLCVPLKTGSGTIGCVQVLNRQGASRYDEEDLRFCERAAALIASAIERSGTDSVSLR